MYYSVKNFEGKEVAVVETEYSMTGVLELLKKAFNQQFLDYDPLKHGVKQRFYVYEYHDGNFRDIRELGYVDTKRDWRDVYDFIAEVFGPNGIFIRREKVA